MADPRSLGHHRRPLFQSHGRPDRYLLETSHIPFDRQYRNSLARLPRLPPTYCHARDADSFMIATSLRSSRHRWRFAILAWLMISAAIGFWSLGETASRRNRAYSNRGGNASPVVLHPRRVRSRLAPCAMDLGGQVQRLSPTRHRSSRLRIV